MKNALTREAPQAEEKHQTQSQQEEHPTLQKNLFEQKAQPILNIVDKETIHSKTTCKTNIATREQIPHVYLSRN